MNVLIAYERIREQEGRTAKNLCEVNNFCDANRMFANQFRLNEMRNHIVITDRDQ